MGKNPDDNSKDVDNQNNDGSSSNNASSVFTRRHDPIREFFEKEERLKKEKDQQQQTKIRETNVDDQMEQLPVPGHSEKMNKLTDQHVKERPVEKTLHENPQMVVSKESSKIIKPI